MLGKLKLKEKKIAYALRINGTMKNFLQHRQENLMLPRNNFTLTESIKKKRSSQNLKRYKNMITRKI